MRIRSGLTGRAARLVGMTVAIGACAPLPQGAQSDESVNSLVIDNRTTLEVVVYAVPAGGAKGIRLTNSRSFATDTVDVPSSALQGVDRMVVRLHMVGTATGASDWVSPRITLNNGLIGKLDIRADSRGDMSNSSFYTAARRSVQTP